MTSVVWDGDNSYEMVLEAHCSAAPSAVYDVLANPETHLDWAGRRQRHGFRLTALRADGPMRAGGEFTSVGSMPMTRTRWQDHSVVVRADPAAVIEFHTDGVAVWPSGRRTEARWEHRYDIEPAADGARVTYRLRRASMTNPPLRMRVPLVAALTHRMMIPFLCRRGLSNLLRAAEQRAGSARLAARPCGSRREPQGRPAGLAGRTVPHRGIRRVLVLLNTSLIGVRSARRSRVFRPLSPSVGHSGLTWTPPRADGLARRWMGK